MPPTRRGFPRKRTPVLRPRKRAPRPRRDHDRPAYGDAGVTWGVSTWRGRSTCCGNRRRPAVHDGRAVCGGMRARPRMVELAHGRAALTGVVARAFAERTKVVIVQPGAAGVKRIGELVEAEVYPDPASATAGAAGGPTAVFRRAVPKMVAAQPTTRSGRGPKSANTCHRGEDTCTQGSVAG